MRLIKENILAVEQVVPYAPVEIKRADLNVEMMIWSLLRKANVLLCGGCMGAHGLSDDETVDGARRSTTGDLAGITLGTDRVLVF